MEPNFDKTIQERAVLVGLNAACFTQAQTATDETLEELEALLETAGGFCTAKGICIGKEVVTVKEVHDRIAFFSIVVACGKMNVQGAVLPLGGVEKIPFDDHDGELLVIIYRLSRMPISTQLKNLCCLINACRLGP